MDIGKSMRDITLEGSARRAVGVIRSRACHSRAGSTPPGFDSRCLANVETILQAAGSSLQCVLRRGVFLLDMAEFPQMNAVYARVFGDHRPARTTIQAAALPVTQDSLGSLTLRARGSSLRCLPRHSSLAWGARQTTPIEEVNMAGDAEGPCWFCRTKPPDPRAAAAISLHQGWWDTKGVAPQDAAWTSP
jgi:enamine deaminase RidA (YjgF/YER057c/UK114 family)